MTDLDQAGQPAKEYKYRAWNPQTGDIIYLEDPRYIKYHTGYQLQQRDENETWVTVGPSDEDASA